VAYTIALLAEVCAKRKQAFDFQTVWDHQAITPATTQAIEIAAKFVHDDITNPRVGVSNVTE
jgi:hypothetical protein